MIELEWDSGMEEQKGGKSPSQGILHSFQYTFLKGRTIIHPRIHSLSTHLLIWQVFIEELPCKRCLFKEDERRVSVGTENIKGLAAIVDNDFRAKEACVLITFRHLILKADADCAECAWWTHTPACPAALLTPWHATWAFLLEGLAPSLSGIPSEELPLMQLVVSHEDT